MESEVVNLVELGGKARSKNELYRILVAEVICTYLLNRFAQLILSQMFLVQEKGTVNIFSFICSIFAPGIRVQGGHRQKASTNKRLDNFRFYKVSD